jgi:hypothetical protein
MLLNAAFLTAVMVTKGNISGLSPRINSHYIKFFNSTNETKPYSRRSFL